MTFLKHFSFVFALWIAATGARAALAQQGGATSVDPTLIDEFAPPSAGARAASQRRGANATGAQTRNPATTPSRGQNVGAAVNPPVEQADDAANGADNRTATSTTPNRLFMALDVNGDGQITPAEFRRAAASTKSLDTNGDGNISAAEAGGGGVNANLAGGAGVASGAADQALAQYDRNGDGKITQSELPPEAARMFTQMDANRDGELTRDELNSAAASMSAQWGGMMGGPMGPGGANMGGIGQIMQYDRNGDRRITADEVPPQLAAMLRGADRNGDGAIDMQEIAAMAQQAQGMSPATRGFGPGGINPPGDGQRNGRGN
jgi:Ca2+-binding EF-hand superfamily protein